MTDSNLPQPTTQGNFKVGDEITAKFKNHLDQELTVTGQIHEIKNGALCCKDQKTGRSFAVNFDEVVSCQKVDVATSKYDWSVVPSYFNWIATDRNGMVCYFSHKPLIEGDCDYWTNHADTLYLETYSESEFEQWQDSLEQRPSDLEVLDLIHVSPNCKVGGVMSELIKVVDCRDFGLEFDDLCVLLSDYEDIDCERYELQLDDLIKNKSFSFDESKHEYWDLG